MPTKVEKDAITGTETTGHEWDGIKELNTPLPKWWVYVFYATIVWALIYYVLYPAIPGPWGYTKGILGYSQRAELEQKLSEARAEQAKWRDAIRTASVADIRNSEDLLNFAVAGGRAAFADNCAPCHGLGGAGQSFYPTLADDDWLWGGTPEDIETTIRYGIRSGHDEARDSEMPAFGADEILSGDEIEAVANYVVSMAGGESADAALAEEGRAVFAENCAACHGERGEGDPSVGAPRLNDAIWLYGGTVKDVMAQVTKPRHGVMPSWEGRLDDATIKMLAVYVHSLGGGQ